MKLISEVYNMDCMEGLKHYPDKFFDLAVVDPPYGIKAHMGTNKHTKEKFMHRKEDTWDNSAPDESYFLELFRVSVSQIIWGANHFIEKIPGANSSCFCIWDKKIRGYYFSDCEYAWVSKRKEKGVSGGRVFEYNPTLPSKRLSKIHPTQKPVELYKWLLGNYGKKGDKILDTHMGSQSSRIAAYDMGCNYWGFEIDKEYFEQGCKRFESFKSQLKLF